MTAATLFILFVMIFLGAILSPIAILFFAVISIIEFMVSFAMEKCGLRRMLKQ